MTPGTRRYRQYILSFQITHGTLKLETLDYENH